MDCNCFSFHLIFELWAISSLLFDEILPTVLRVCKEIQIWKPRWPYSVSYLDSVLKHSDNRRWMKGCFDVFRQEPRRADAWHLRRRLMVWISRPPRFVRNRHRHSTYPLQQQIGIYKRSLLHTVSTIFVICTRKWFQRVALPIRSLSNRINIVHRSPMNLQPSVNI